MHVGVLKGWVAAAKLCERFIYLFVMTACSLALLEKQIKCLERGRASNPEVMPSSPMNKCKMQKQNVVLPFPV
jgi:hypothetical protein